MSTARFSTLGLALETFDRVILGKALPSILTQDGFLREVLREANLLQRGVRKSVDEVMDQVRRSTNINWRGASAAQQAAVVLQLGNLLKGLPSEFLPAVKIVLDERGQIVFRKTKKAIKKRHKSLDINPTLRLVDQEGVAALRDTTSLFFSPEYERQADRFTSRAQKQITNGLERGLSRAEIADELSEEFRETAINRAYWETTAAVHVNRARSFSSTLSYSQAGVTEYEVIAVMDERTTEMCFPPGTPITSCPGKTRPIERISPGDLVLGRDGRRHRVEGVSVRSSSEWVRITLENGREIEVTPEHPIWIKSGPRESWEKAGRIKANDFVFELRRSSDVVEDLGASHSRFDCVKVVRVERIEITRLAYNLQVADDPVYLVDGILVHNCAFLNGKILTIESAVKSFDAFEAAKTLEEVRDEVMPFLRVRGEEIVLPSGQRVATINAPREFSNGMTPKQLNGAGVNMPPYHFRCRTTIAPVI